MKLKLINHKDHAMQSSSCVSYVGVWVFLGIALIGASLSKVVLGTDEVLEIGK